MSMCPQTVIVGVLKTWLSHCITVSKLLYYCQKQTKQTKQNKKSLMRKESLTLVGFCLSVRNYLLGLYLGWHNCKQA